MNNNYFSKIIRIVTSVLPVDRNKGGACTNCGACCKLPKPCVFLKYGANNKAICRIYKFRPLNCRNYPRSSKEHITSEICGYYFEND